MKVRLLGHDLKYHAESMIGAFFPCTKITYANEDFSDCGIVSTLFTEGTGIRATCFARVNGAEETAEVKSEISEKHPNEAAHIVKLSIYYALLKLTKKELPWGAMVGIRPVKNATLMLLDGESDAEILNMYKNRFMVSDKKAELALSIAKAEEKYLLNKKKNGVSLYVGIPFCPTRCSYCSFFSGVLTNNRSEVLPYLAALKKELYAVFEIIKNNSCTLESIYIGGGTPTTLNEAELALLLSNISEIFDLSGVKEYTVEAGRPETITAEKLRIMATFGVTRISINPQTIHEKTLKLIGRNHKTADFYKAFALAREIGGFYINCDLIAGLPGEDLSDFKESVMKITELSPENITVHTLSKKKGSAMHINGEELKEGGISAMVDFAREYLYENGYFPYYLYRQKNMAENLENIGYSKCGLESIYNIYIMEEVQTILAAGASASTKIVKGSRIERIFNVKFAKDYIDRIDEMIDRKKGLILNEIQ